MKEDEFMLTESDSDVSFSATEDDLSSSDVEIGIVSDKVRRIDFNLCTLNEYRNC